jgi:hypothetical protein
LTNFGGFKQDSPNQYVQKVIPKQAIPGKCYSLHPKLLDTFDKNKNTKEYVRNLQKRPTRT